MKKFTTSLLALSMAASMTVTAFADQSVTLGDDTTTETSVDQFYTIEQEGKTEYTDVKKVQVDWKVSDIQITFKNKKIWNPTTRKWEKKSKEDGDLTATNGTAEFTFTNFSSVPVKATAAFAAEETKKGMVAKAKFDKDSVIVKTPVLHDENDDVYPEEAFTALKQSINADISIDTNAISNPKAAKGEILGTYTVAISEYSTVNLTPNPSYVYNSSIASVIYSDHAPEVYNEELTRDVSREGNRSVLAYYDNTDSNNIVLTVAPGEGYEGAAIMAPKDNPTFISGCNAKYIDLTNVDYSECVAKNSNFHDYFNNSKAETIKGLHLSGITNMNFMFMKCANLKYVDLSGIDTSEVVSMTSMFQECTSLQNLDFSGFDFSKVSDMQQMFKDCTNLNTITVDSDSFNTASLTNAYGMFYNCNSLTSNGSFIKLLNTENVRDMDNMFYGCSNLSSVDLSGWNTENATTMYSMFDGCESLTELDLTSFNTANCTSYRGMFYGCNNLSIVKVTAATWRTEGTDTNNMFYNCKISEVTPE